MDEDPYESDNGSLDELSGDESPTPAELSGDESPTPAEPMEAKSEIAAPTEDKSETLTFRRLEISLDILRTLHDRLACRQCKAVGMDIHTVSHRGHLVKWTAKCRQCGKLEANSSDERPAYGDSNRRNKATLEQVAATILSKGQYTQYYTQQVLKGLPCISRTTFDRYATEVNQCHCLLL